METAAIVPGTCPPETNNKLLTGAAQTWHTTESVRGNAMPDINTLQKEPVEIDQWPVEIGEQMAAAHRIYPDRSAPSEQPKRPPPSKRARAVERRA
jgi:hypothetical protein